MIQIYSPGNTNFEQNGDMTLFPEICEAPSKLGGAWTLEITHPIDDEGRWKYIEREAVLSVPTFMGENQLYRIDQITDKNDVDISAKAYPIFYDAADEVFLMDKRPEAKNGQETLDILTEGTKYSGESNISTGNTAYFVRRNLMDCISGDDYPTFIQVWGGEPLYRNYKVILNERAGGDYGAEVRYGKNMDGVNVQEDMSAVVTRIVPVAYNGRLLSSESVDSPLINNYAKVYTKEIKFEDVRYYDDIDEGTDTTDLIVCNSQEELDVALITKCNEQFEAGIDLYKVTIDVDMVALENTEEYKDFQDLVKIGIGDDVTCINTRLGINVKARAIEVVWDCITDSAKSVVLGDYKVDFLAKWNSTFEQVEKVLNKDGSVRAQYIKGVLNAMDTQLKFQKNAAQKQEVRAILFEDLDQESSLYGALSIGTQGIQIANKRTADDRDWDWSTAITANGAYADVLVAGILADKKGKTFWNLDTGEFVLSPETKITWGQVMETDDIPITEMVTQITKNTITTDYINALKVIAGSVAAEDITGKTITGKKIVGSTFTNDSVASNFWPIQFIGTSGDTLKLGPDNAKWKNTMDNTTCMISGNKIVLGKNIDDTSFTGDMSIDPLFGIYSKPTYEHTQSSAANIYVASNGMFFRSTSSSKRYKKDITENISTELDPKRLYEIPIKMFKYKEGYLQDNDIKNGKDTIGFIVEDLEEVYPEAVQYEKGLPEMWNANILIPAMLKLIQEQNIRLEELEGRNVN